MADPGGRFKPADNDIIERHEYGSPRVRFRPASAHLTPISMDELAANYAIGARAPTLEPLILVPPTILDFLCIHPFADGNGRTARLLTLILLYHFDYEVGSYISIERICEETKESYYEILKASSHGCHEARQDPHPWFNYARGVMLRAYREFEQRVDEVRKDRGSNSEQVREAVLAKSAPFLIFRSKRIAPVSPAARFVWCCKS